MFTINSPHQNAHEEKGLHISGGAAGDPVAAEFARRWREGKRCFMRFARRVAFGVESALFFFFVLTPFQHFFSVGGSDSRQADAGQLPACA